jgi:hypothetical protein
MSSLALHILECAASRQNGVICEPALISDRIGHGLAAALLLGSWRLATFLYDFRKSLE